jgi:hypothetical protein
MAFTLTFLEHASEDAVGAAAAAALTVFTSGAFHLVGDVPWYAVLSAAAIGGVGSLLKSLVSMSVQNGTASINPRVVAASEFFTPKTGP